MPHVATPRPADPTDSTDPAGRAAIDPTLDAALEEEFYQSERTARLRRYPWLLMLDSLRVALDPRKLVLALVALLLLSWGDDLIGLLPLREAARQAVGDGPGSVVASLGLDDERFASADSVLRPIGSVDVPLVQIADARITFAAAADRVLTALWALFVWALFGGAIARMAALKLSGDRPGGMLESLRYSARYLFSSLGGPLTPLTAIAMLWGLGALVGLIDRIPVAGPIVAGVLYGLLVVLGVLAMLMLVGTLLAWPLMVATLAVDGTDAYDALSRGFGYVFGRGFYFAFLALLMLLLGAIGSWLATTAAELVVALADRFFEAGASEEVIQPGERPDWGTSLVASWRLAVLAVGQAFPAAYFWTAAAAMYLLLRRSFDGTPTTEVWVPPSTEKDDLLPLVGEPAAKRREEAEAARTADAAAETTGEQADD